MTSEELRAAQTMMLDDLAMCPEKLVEVAVRGLVERDLLSPEVARMEIIRLLQSAQRLRDEKETLENFCARVVKRSRLL